MIRKKNKLLKFEFEARIFISFGIVALVCLLSFSTFKYILQNSVLLGKLIGINDDISINLGYLGTIILLGCASVLRMWAGSILTSNRMMAFKVQVDSLVIRGPYLIVRNPIYLADIIVFVGFTLFLNIFGLLLPILLYIHYTRLVKFEEESLVARFKNDYINYRLNTPCLIPGLNIKRISDAFKHFEINYDGFRHNSLYVLFIPGFIITIITGELLYGIIIGLPAVVDWAIIHTRKGISRNGKVPKRKKIFEDIIYAQCWEDPELDRIAFQIKNNDVIFSITSGGCNTLTFLLDNPRKVIALDLNPSQNYLLKLKITAFKKLNYEELLELMGVKNSSNRLEIYRKIRDDLDKEAQIYWDDQIKKIKKGIIHCGRYEKYMRMLRVILLFLVGRKLIGQFFELEDNQKRVELFLKKFENIRWTFFTRIMLSRTVMSLLFDKDFFKYLDNNFSFGKHFAEKVKYVFTQLPMKDNYFISYTLFGNYFNEEYLPVYLRRENYDIIRSRLDRIEIVTDSCESYFKKLPDNYISRFNYSNIFEWMSQDAYEKIINETIRIAKNNAVITYRNLLVFRESPKIFNGSIIKLDDLSGNLLKRDLSFIYNNYVVEKIIKREKNAIQSHTSLQSSNNERFS